MANVVVTRAASSLLTSAISLGLATALLLSVTQPILAQQQPTKKDASKTGYRKIKPKVGKFKDLAKGTVTQLTAPPSGFPVPVYSGRFMYGSERTSELGKTVGVQIRANDNVETITQWYRSGLKSAGWKVQEPMPGGQGAASLSAFKTGMLCRVQLRAIGKGTDISLSLSQK